MVTQAQMVKAKSKNKTKVFVYRQGQGLSVSFGRQAHDVLTDPAYDGAFRRRFSAHPVLARLDGLADTHGGLPRVRVPAGFWLKTVNGTAMPGTINHTDGRRIGGTFDFR